MPNGEWVKYADHVEKLKEAVTDAENKAGSGGRTEMKCHYCQQAVQFQDRHPMHIDGSELCKQGNVTRWIESHLR